MISTETKVGFFVLAALAGVAWLGLKSGEFSTNGLGRNGRILSSSFEDAGGLGIGSQVKISGVKIGEVVDIHLNRDGEAVVTMSIRKDLTLPSNIKAQIASSGLIGEKFISLTTIYSPEGELPEEVISIPSRNAGGLENLAGNFSQVSEDLKEVTTSLREALGGKENADKIANIVNRLNSIGTRMDNILSEEIEPGQVGNIVNNFSNFSDSIGKSGNKIVEDLAESAAALRKILESNEDHAAKMIENFSMMAENFSKVAEKLNKGEGFLGKLLTDDDNPLANFDDAMKDIKEAAAKINGGEGTLGRLINDPATAEKIDNALDSFSEISGRISSFRTEIDFNGYMLTNEHDIYKGRFSVLFSPRPSRYYVVGVTADGFATKADGNDSRNDNAYVGQEFGKEIKFTAQFGQVFEKLIFDKDIGFRVGLRDSTIGLGIDTAFWGNFVEVSGDLYDFGGKNSGDHDGKPHLDLTAKVNLVDRMIYAVGGYDNVLNKEYGSPFIGVGFRFYDDDLKYLVGAAL